MKNLSSRRRHYSSAVERTCRMNLRHAVENLRSVESMLADAVENLRCIESLTSDAVKNLCCVEPLGDWPLNSIARRKSASMPVDFLHL